MTRVKELADIYKVPGMLTAHEVDCLFQLGQIDHCDGVIVEIGNWKGKSTIALARGAPPRTGKKSMLSILMSFNPKKVTSGIPGQSFLPTSNEGQWTAKWCR